MACLLIAQAPLTVHPPEFCGVHLQSVDPGKFFRRGQCSRVESSDYREANDAFASYLRINHCH